MKISVVCATYRPNGFYGPAKCLAAQSRPPDEIVWVLDGVGEAEAFAGMAKPAGSRVMSVPDHESYGVAVPYNTGCDAATGDLLMMIGDNAWFSPELLHFHEKVAEMEKFALLSGGSKEHEEPRTDYLTFKGEECSCRGRIYPWDAISDTVALKTSWLYVTVSGLAVPRALFEDVGGFDERTDGGAGCNDILFAARASVRSPLPVAVTTHPTLLMHQMKRPHTDKVHKRDNDANAIMVYNLIKTEVKKRSIRIYTKGPYR